MTTSCLSGVFRVGETVAATLGVGVNWLLLFVVLRCKKKELLPYRRIILCNCFADMLFSVSTYVVEVVSALGRITHLCNTFTLSMRICETARLFSSTMESNSRRTQICPSLSGFSRSTSPWQWPPSHWRIAISPYASIQAVR